MDGWWVCYEQLGVWCNFSILWLDPSPHLPIFGENGKLPQILPIIWRCCHLAHWCNQTPQHVKTGKYSFERGINSLYILVKNTQVSLYSFLRNRGKFHLRRSPLSLVLLSFTRCRCQRAVVCQADCRCCGVLCNSSPLVKTKFYWSCGQFVNILHKV